MRRWISSIESIKVCRCIAVVVLCKPRITAHRRQVISNVASFRTVCPSEETFPYLLLGAQDQRLGAEQDQLPCGSTGTSPCNCEETETCMVRACHTPRQPLQNHHSGHHGGWASPLSAEDMLDRQHKRADTPVHARTAHKNLLQTRLEEDLC